MNSTFEQELSKNGRLIFTNVGDSMWPLIIEGRDLIIIEKCDLPLKKYDIPLYKRDSGQYVLHRILKVKKGGYVLCGDNRATREYGICDRHILGKLTGIIRNGRQVNLIVVKYKIYTHLWCDFYFLRALIIKIYGKIKRYAKIK